MPPLHPTTGPVRFLSPVRFLARKAEWSGSRNFYVGAVPVITSGYGPRAAWHGCIVRAPHGNLQCFSYPTGPVRGPCVTHKGAVWRPYGHARELAKPKIPHGRRLWPCGARTGPLRHPHGLFTGCLRSLNPYGARKLIMHALKLYGPRTGRQNSYGSARDPCGPREWTYDFCAKQPGNSPGTGPGSVMWLRHNPDKNVSWGQHWAHLGPIEHRWPPCWPREPCYLGRRLIHPKPS